MATLNETQKHFVVTELACFRTPSEVAEAVKEEFGLEVSRQQVAYYDPRSRTGRKPSAKWQQLFEETRRQWLGNTSAEGIANRRWRFRELSRLYEKSLALGRGGNLKLAQSLLEQAAKESGDMYTNRFQLEHSGRDGEPLEVKVTRTIVSENGRSVDPGPEREV